MRIKLVIFVETVNKLMNVNDLLLDEQLNAFTKALNQVILRNLQTGKIRPQLEPYKQYEIEDFTYGDNGPGYTRSACKTLYRENWINASFFLSDIVFKMDEYRSVRDFIQQNYVNPDAANQFLQYTFQLLAILSEHRKNPTSTVYDNHKRKLFQEINLQPHQSRTVVNLFGVLLEPSEIVLADGVKLRQTVKADLEQPRGVEENHPFLAMPSTILEIELLLTHEEHASFHHKVTKYVKLLRLYQTGSVSYNSYWIHFDRLTSTGQGMGMPGQLVHPWAKYCIRKIDQDNFLHFINYLPTSSALFSENKKPNYVTTAFDRFSESLLEKLTIEKRVANAIMGIEALLSNDSFELKFRMQTRTGKLMSNFGFEPITVRDQINKAYDIRSKFAHGGYLSEQDKVKIENTFGNINDFTLSIVNYLRILIIIALVCKIDKSGLLNLIDDALIDDNKAIELKETIEPVHEFIISRNSRPFAGN